MLCRYSLIVGNISHELGDWCVKNWDEISYSINRIDYGGVTRSLTSEFQFFGNAYDILLEEYLHNYLLSEAVITVETVDDNHRFIEKLRYRLDFSKLSYDGQLLSIYAFDDSLSTLIKANKSTQYEYKVSELKEVHPLYYDRLMMQNKIEWIPTGETDEEEKLISNVFEHVSGDGELYSVYTYPLYIKGTPEIAIKNIIEVVDIANAYTNARRDEKPFFKNISTKTINVNLEGALHMNVSWSGSGSARLFMAIDGKTYIYDLRQGENIVSLSDFKVGSSFLPQNAPVGPGKCITFTVGTVTDTTISQPLSDAISLDFAERDNPVDIDIINPTTLLNSLLRSINGDKEGITGKIIAGVDPRLDNALIVPAESARGIAEANLYTSYTKFEKWMSVMFGYVPVIGNNTVTFVHRDSNYTQEIGVEFEEVNDFEYEVKDSLVYSLVRAGYEKKDYDSVNGRDEFRWTTDFNTGISITGNKMELISPYRADSYGIEFLVQKRGEDTTDSSSDNDVFFVCANLNEDATKYLLARSGYEISGVINADTMFNAMYSIRSILEANKRFLGISISNLKFASSEGNSDVVINGVGERDDFVIDKADRLFTAGEITFSSTIDAGEINLPKVGKLNKDGIMYEVYVLESKRKYGKYDGTSYKMCVKSMS